MTAEGTEFSDGSYVATFGTHRSIGTDGGLQAAVVAVRDIEDKTLMDGFKGTDRIAEFCEWLPFSRHCLPKMKATNGSFVRQSIGRPIDKRIYAESRLTCISRVLTYYFTLSSGRRGKYGVVTSFALFDHLLGFRLPVVIIACDFAISSSCMLSSPIHPTSRPMLVALLCTTGTIVARDSPRGIEFTTSGF